MDNIFFETIGLENTDIIEDLQEIQKEVKKTENVYKLSFEHILKEAKEYEGKVKENNPYAEAIRQAKAQEHELTAYAGKYKNIYEKMARTDKWYINEYSKILANKNKMSEETQIQAFFDLGNLYNIKKSQNAEEILKQHTENLRDIVQDGLSDILADCNDFDVAIKGLTQKLYAYLLEQSLQWATSKFTSSGWFKNLSSILGGLDNIGKGTAGLVPSKSVWNTVKSIFGITKFHDGGIVPIGANTELAGTKEQLALLKGGERILSPGENASYNSSASQVSPVVFNNYNIKAWDSKDVSKYLLENRQLLNQITYQGIKDNNAMLRYMVRNA